MLNFSLEDNNLIYKNQKIEIIDIDGILAYPSLDNIDEINKDIIDYFDNNDFSRLFAKISPSELDNSTIRTMYSFLNEVEIVKKELEIIIDKYAKTYFLILAVRSEFTKENFKVFCLKEKINSIPEIEACLHNEAHDWFSGYEIETLPLTNIDDFINKIREWFYTFISWVL